VSKEHILGGILLVLIAASVVGVGLLNPHYHLSSFDHQGPARIISAADQSATNHYGSTKPRGPQLPHMQLQGQYAGPLQDTIIQRWRDPVDGTVCYIYLPITVQHSPPTPSGLVQYGVNGIGSISCIPSQPGSRQ
jgi:hypothetical protein